MNSPITSLWLRGYQIRANLAHSLINFTNSIPKNKLVLSAHLVHRFEIILDTGNDPRDLSFRFLLSTFLCELFKRNGEAFYCFSKFILTPIKHVVRYSSLAKNGALPNEYSQSIRHLGVNVSSSAAIIVRRSARSSSSFDLAWYTSKQKPDPFFGSSPYSYMCLKFGADIKKVSDGLQVNLLPDGPNRHLNDEESDARADQASDEGASEGAKIVRFFQKPSRTESFFDSQDGVDRADEGNRAEYDERAVPPVSPHPAHPPVASGLSLADLATAVTMVAPRSASCPPLVHRAWW